MASRIVETSRQGYSRLVHILADLSYLDVKFAGLLSGGRQ